MSEKASMSNEQPAIFYDRSRCVDDWICHRRRYLRTEYGGRGLAPVTRTHALALGSVVHELFECAFKAHLEAGTLDTAMGLAATLQEACDTVLPPFVESLRATGATPDRASEQAALAEGLFRGWFAARWREFHETYEVLGVEVECLYPHDGCIFASKPDLVVRRRADGTVWYWEWKTTSNVRDSWFKQWNYDIQFLAGALGVQATLGLEITGVIVQGLYKGYERENASGVKEQYSPLCYVYAREVGTVHGVEVEYSLETQRGKGWHKVGTWVDPGGVAAHVERLHTLAPDTLLAQFPQTPPHFIHAERLRTLLRQRAMRERDIALASADILVAQSHGHAELAALDLDVYFPQSFNACAPAFGSPCPFRDVCHVASIGEDPLASGLYDWRVPHHTTDPLFTGVQDDEEEEAA
jgi:hypothetical protein